MKHAIELKDNQFLKIRSSSNWGITEFEIFEFPLESWKRPRRWVVELNHYAIINRHNRESKIRRLDDVFWALKIALDESNLAGIDTRLMNDVG
jgi:hypothetical protein